MRVQVQVDLQGNSGSLLLQVARKTVLVLESMQRSLIFASLKKSSFFKSMSLINFPIQWYLNILIFFYISMIINKYIFQWVSIDVTTRSQHYCLFKTPSPALWLTNVLQPPKLVASLKPEYIFNNVKLLKNFYHSIFKYFLQC